MTDRDESRRPDGQDGREAMPDDYQDEIYGAPAAEPTGRVQPGELVNVPGDGSEAAAMGRDASPERATRERELDEDARRIERRTKI